MKNKFFKTLVTVSAILSCCFMFSSFSPSLDGRAVVVEEGVFPQGLFAKTVGYLPGDIISVTNISGEKTVDILVIGALDPSEGVAIMLSPEAAKAIGLEKANSNIVKITKRSGQDERVYGSAVIARQINDYTEPEEEAENEAPSIPYIMNEDEYAETASTNDAVSVSMAPEKTEEPISMLTQNDSPVYTPINQPQPVLTSAEVSAIKGGVSDIERKPKTDGFSNVQPDENVNQEEEVYTAMNLSKEIRDIPNAKSGKLDAVDTINLDEISVDNNSANQGGYNAPQIVPPSEEQVVSENPVSDYEAPLYEPVEEEIKEEPLPAEPVDIDELDSVNEVAPLVYDEQDEIIGSYRKENTIKADDKLPPPFDEGEAYKRDVNPVVEEVQKDEMYTANQPRAEIPSQTPFEEDEIAGEYHNEADAAKEVSSDSSEEVENTNEAEEDEATEEEFVDDESVDESVEETVDEELVLPDENPIENQNEVLEDETFSAIELTEPEEESLPEETVELDELSELKEEELEVDADEPLNDVSEDESAGEEAVETDDFEEYPVESEEMTEDDFAPIQVQNEAVEFDEFEEYEDSDEEDFDLLDSETEENDAEEFITEELYFDENEFIGENDESDEDLELDDDLEAEDVGESEEIDEEPAPIVNPIFGNIDEVSEDFEDSPFFVEDEIISENDEVENLPVEDENIEAIEEELSSELDEELEAEEVEETEPEAEEKPYVYEEEIVEDFEGEDGEYEEYNAISLVPADDNPPEMPENEEIPSEEKEVALPVLSELPVNENNVSINPVPVEEAEKEDAYELEVVKDSKTAGSYEKYIVSNASELKKSMYYVQIATLRNDENILEIVEKYAGNYPVAIIPLENGSRQVLVGPLSVDEYATVLERFKAYGFKDAFLKKIK